MKLGIGKLSALALLLVVCHSACAADRVLVRLTRYDNTVLTPVQPVTTGAGQNFFDVHEFSGNVEQTLNIGSQSSGAGAGKITFDPFSFSLPPTSVDPQLFQMCAAGTAFKTMEVMFYHPLNASGAIGAPYLVLTLKLVAVKTIGWSLDASGNGKTTITFLYGGLVVGGATGVANQYVTLGWNRVNNVSDNSTTTVLGSGH